MNTIRCQSIFGAEPFMCVRNVEKRIRALGGRAVYGWQYRRCPFYVMKTNHVVWESPDGELVCVTPVFTGIEGEQAIMEFPATIEFETNDAAYFEGKATTVEYIPTVDDPKLARACEIMRIADNFLFHGNDISKAKYWTEKANALVRHLGVRWETPATFDAKDWIPTCVE